MAVYVEHGSKNSMIKFSNQNYWKIQVQHSKNKWINKVNEIARTRTTNRQHTDHDSNSSWDWKISGKMKFNNDQSSAKLFCRGVPVNRSLFSTGKCFNSLSNLHFEFFSRCPFRKKVIVRAYIYKHSIIMKIQPLTYKKERVSVVKSAKQSTNKC